MILATASPPIASRAGAIDRGALHDIVAACIQAPSGDNCQPWRFVWDGSALVIHHDEARARHPLNRGGYGSLLALGGVVESAAVRATMHGLRSEIAYGGLGADDAAPWATVRFAYESSSIVDPLSGAIAARCTDRRLYFGGVIGPELAAALAADAVGSSRIRTTAAVDAETIAYIARAESSLMSDPAAFAAVMSWVRFDHREAMARRDGMPWRNLGVSFVEVPILMLLRACPWLVRPMARCGSAALQRRLVDRQIRSSAGLVSITTTDTSRASVVDVGRSAMRAWLRLTLAGFGVQPLSLSSLNAYLASVTDEIEPSAAWFFRDGRWILSRAFSVEAGELPIWMFRAGTSPALPEAMRTMRLRVEDVLECVLRTET